jgi:hypothetical protein
LSVHLGCAGDGAGGLAAIQEAVDAYRRLAKDNPMRFAPDLAGSLNNLSIHLRFDNDTVSALAAIHEAVEICRQLVKDSPERFSAQLSRSLSVLEMIEGN